MEKIESFVPGSDAEQLPFYIELAGITYPTVGYEIQREKSEIYVLEYIVSGTGTVEVNGQVFHPVPGDVYLLPRDSRHHYYAAKEDPFQKIWMNVGGELCRQLIQLYGLSGKYHFPAVFLREPFERFLSVCRNRDSEMQIIFDRCSLIFMEILQHLSRNSESRNTANRYAALAKNFCDRNIYEKITADDAARCAGLSVSQLSRLFRREYGITVYAYILNNKIRTAKSLLTGTSLSVGEIAYLLKFADEHYFSNIFKKKTGKTPTQWRSLSA